MVTMMEVIENMKTEAACTTASVAVTEGIVVSGGNAAGLSVELFIPGTGSCKLPSLPQERVYHTSVTLDNHTVVVCGGNTAQVQNECLQFSPTTFFWQDFATTKNGGTDVTGWVNSDGLVLVDSDKAEVVRSQKIFEYRHSGHHEGSCAITGDDFIILTGGKYKERTVTKFNSKFEHQMLPSLSQERTYHGCGAYNKGSSLVLLVAGGYKGNAISSVEILDYPLGAHWVTAQSLPGPVGFVSSVSLGGRVYIIGGYNGDQRSKDVFVFDGKRWNSAGELHNARSSSAATKVNADIMNKFCM